MAAPASKPSKRYRALRLIACICAGLLLAVPVYVGLAKSGVIRSPFFPRADGDIALAKSDRPGLRVLFVGNSFTYYNEMPAMVHELAAADRGARPVFSVEYAAPNWSLNKASEDDGLADLIDGVDWGSSCRTGAPTCPSRRSGGAGRPFRSPWSYGERSPRPVPSQWSS